MVCSYFLHVLNVIQSYVVYIVYMCDYEPASLSRSAGKGVPGKNGEGVASGAVFARTKAVFLRVPAQINVSVFQSKASEAKSFQAKALSCSPLNRISPSEMRRLTLATLRVSRLISEGEIRFRGLLRIAARGHPTVYSHGRLCGLVRPADTLFINRRH